MPRTSAHAPMPAPTSLSALVTQHRGTDRADKTGARRLALAESALKTIGELGYARSSLREIAANSEFSHGVVHYYFDDKIELITFSVRVFKTACSKRYDAIVESAITATELVDGVLAAMAATLSDELALHRLWYDLRSQSMFEPRIREDVEIIDELLEQMIWRIVTRYAALNSSELAADAPTAYAIIDGLFSQAVVRQDPAALLTARVRAVLPTLLR